MIIALWVRVNYRVVALRTEVLAFHESFARFHLVEICLFEVLIYAASEVMVALVSLLVRVQEIGFFLWDVPQILGNRDVDSLERLLDVSLDHVHVFSDFIFQGLVDLKQIHFNPSNVLMGLGFVLF